MMPSVPTTAVVGQPSSSRGNQLWCGAQDVRRRFGKFTQLPQLQPEVHAQTVGQARVVSLEQVASLAQPVRLEQPVRVGHQGTVEPPVRVDHPTSYLHPMNVEHPVTLEQLAACHEQPLVNHGQLLSLETLVNQAWMASQAQQVSQSQLLKQAQLSIQTQLESQPQPARAVQLTSQAQLVSQPQLAPAAYPTTQCNRKRRRSRTSQWEMAPGALGSGARCNRKRRPVQQGATLPSESGDTTELMSCHSHYVSTAATKSVAVPLHVVDTQPKAILQYQYQYQQVHGHGTRRAALTSQAVSQNMLTDTILQPLALQQQQQEYVEDEEPDEEEEEEEEEQQAHTVHRRNLKDDYDQDWKLVGQGSFGFVYRARHLASGDWCALKHIVRQDGWNDADYAEAVEKEVGIMQNLDHPNVLHVRDVVRHSPSVQQIVVIVTDYMDFDLEYLLYEHDDERLPVPQAKCFLTQILKALEYMHRRGVMHRDLKPANVLVNRLGQLKIADFGLARAFELEAQEPYTPYVGTRKYNAVELLLAGENLQHVRAAKKRGLAVDEDSGICYGPAVDMWAVALIMFEMLTGTALFPNYGDLSILHNIKTTLGSITEERLPGLHKLPVASRLNLLSQNDVTDRAGRKRNLQAKAWQSRTDLSDAALDLLLDLLEYNPAERITAQGALRHRFFD